MTTRERAELARPWWPPNAGSLNPLYEDYLRIGALTLRDLLDPLSVKMDDQQMAALEIS